MDCPLASRWFRVRGRAPNGCIRQAGRGAARCVWRQSSVCSATNCWDRLGFWPPSSAANG